MLQGACTDVMCRCVCTCLAVLCELQLQGCYTADELRHHKLTPAVSVLVHTHLQKNIIIVMNKITSTKDLFWQFLRASQFQGAIKRLNTRLCESLGRDGIAALGDVLPYLQQIFSASGQPTTAACDTCRAVLQPNLFQMMHQLFKEKVSFVVRSSLMKF